MKRTTVRILQRMATGAALVVLIGFINATATELQAKQSAPAEPSGNAKNGRTLLMKIGCYECHGGEGQGGAAGPRIGASPMLAFKAFVTYVRAPRGQMPPYTAKVVSEQDLADIYAFLSSLPKPPAVADIPLLN